MSDDKDQEEDIGTTRQFDGELVSKEDIINVTSLGAGIRLLSDRKVELNSSLANKLLELNPVPAERPLRDQHVEYLMRCYLRGTFRPELVNLASCLCITNKKEYRINAQHTCWTVLLLEKKFKPLPVRLLHYEVGTMEDVKNLYSSFDRNAVRTRGHILTMHMSENEHFGEYPRVLMSLLQSGLMFWVHDSKRKRAQNDADEVAYLMQTTYLNISKVVAGFLHTLPNIGSQRFLLRQASVGAMFGTFSVAVGKSTEFWGGVSSGVGMESASDPRLKLRNYLMGLRVRSGPQIGTGKFVNPETIYRNCAQAWNTFRRGEEVKSLNAKLEGPRPKFK